MPNIEIHGYPHKNGEMSTEANSLSDEIIELTSDLPFKEQMVITVYGTHCFDRKKDSQPFIRILSSDPDHILPLVEVLIPLGVDIETANLTGFYLG